MNIFSRCQLLFCQSSLISHQDLWEKEVPTSPYKAGVLGSLSFASHATFGLQASDGTRIEEHHGEAQTAMITSKAKVSLSTPFWKALGPVEAHPSMVREGPEAS